MKVIILKAYVLIIIKHLSKLPYFKIRNTFII